MEHELVSTAHSSPHTPSEGHNGASSATLRGERSHPDALPTSLLWLGRFFSGCFVLFLLGASITPKLLQMPIAEESMAQLGWPPGYAFLIGVLELTCVVLYLVPQTSVLGAVLMMAILGGAMATHLRAQNPLLSHVLFSVYIGLFMWGGLWLRSPQLRALFPWRRSVRARSSR